MRAAGRHTVPPLILKRVRRPPPDPDSTSQTRQPPSTMRPASLCRPGNRRPPCDQPHLAAPAIAACHADQPTLQTRQPPPARHAARPPYRPNRCRTTQAVPRKTDGCSTFTAPPPLHSQKGQRGQPKGPAVGRGVAEGRGRGGKGSRREGTTEGRDYGREGCNRKARSRIRHGPAESLAEFFRGLCTICKPKYTF